jgi:hypothetical protein
MKAPHHVEEIRRCAARREARAHELVGEER